MANNHVTEMEDLRQRRIDRQTEQSDQADGLLSASEERPAHRHALISGHRLEGRGNTSMRAVTLQTAQRTHGNRAIQRYLQPAGAAPSACVQRWPDLGRMWDTLGAADWRNGGGLEAAGRIADNPTLGTYGSEPNKDRSSYGYGKLTGGGVEGGFSASHEEGNSYGLPNIIDRFAAEAKLGLWDEGREAGPADQRVGFKAGGGLLKGSINQGGLVSGDLGFGTASVDAHAGTNGLSLGAQANIAEGSISGGKFSKDRNDDEFARVGLSAGAGLAGRLHWGDTDNDGNREYGFGFDAGPISVDYKNENLAQAAAPLLGPLTWFPW